MKRILLTAILCACAFATQVFAETLVFTAIPDQDETKLLARFSKVESYLSQSLGIDVRYIPVKSYAAAVTAFQNDQVQLAWFGGLSGVRARLLVPGSRAIAQGVEDLSFVTYFIANSSTGIKASDEFPDQIAGLNFTYGSKGSTSGRLMPEYHILEHFKKPSEEVFNNVGFSGNHSKTIRMVESGSFDAGALNFQVWETELANGDIDTNKVSVIWKTPAYPDYQWTIRGDVDQKFGVNFTQRITDALLNMKDPELLQAFPRSGFIPASNEDYKPILDTAKSIGLID